ncbi:cytochrome P450 [Cristinia sonorae]|uniref:Cytochrome P450 n=1 Tax=Cristinia sonorae TaxID=1940300 RepID=A0A8K0UVF2_9AGAR|nr:cytochrome P450 [Cristinia sonorae]
MSYFLFLFLAFVLWRRWKVNTSNPGKLPLPPGPKPLPIIGNIRDIPLGVPQWELYEAMALKYGDIIHLNVLGQSIVVLSSLEAINDLLEKRSAIYSSRPRSTMMHELMGMGWSLAIMEYGEEWRRVRKAFHQHFNANEADQYHDIHVYCAHSFLRRILRTPEDLFTHTRHLFAKSIMKVTYGIDVKEENDPFIFHAEQTIAAFNTAARPGRYLVDLMPVLKYIPSWFPGARFQKDALYAKDMSQKMVNNPFIVVKEREHSGDAEPCVVARLLDEVPDGPRREEEEDIIRKAAGIAYAGGSDTTVSALQSFFLAMTLYPSVQLKAQAQLETVIGPNRLPTPADMQDLPYIVAITKEVLRWKLVTPLAVPHTTTESDEYRGYFIPKGTIVMGNSYFILHDPAVFPDPHEFKPERFLHEDGSLNPDVLDPTAACFGFGRRICPGRAFAQDSLFSVISSVLHTFNITHAHDLDGNKIPVLPEVTDGLISYPKPFACSIKPRSAAAEAMVRSTE